MTPLTVLHARRPRRLAATASVLSTTMTSRVANAAVVHSAQRRCCSPARLAKLRPGQERLHQLSLADWRSVEEMALAMVPAGMASAQVH